MQRIFFRALLVVSFLISSLTFAHPVIDQYEHILIQLPGWDSSKASISEIGGGATNLNYKIKIADQAYFLRIGSDAGVLGNSIEREYLSSKLASDFKIAPEIVLYNPEHHILVTRFIPAKATALDIHDPETLARVVKQVRSLHQIPWTIPYSMDPYEVVTGYYAKLVEMEVELPSSIKKVLLPALAYIQHQKKLSPKCICHMDLHKGNFLDDGDSIWLLDWEYAGMGDPIFDLATMASADNFTNEQMHQLAETYFERYSHEDYVDLYMMRIVADARWALWSYLQAETSTLDFPYETMAENFLNQALERIAHINFPPICGN